MFLSDSSPFISLLFVFFKWMNFLCDIWPTNLIFSRFRETYNLFFQYIGENETKCPSTNRIYLIHCCSFKSILSALIPKSEFVFIQKLVVYHFSTTCKKLMMNGLLCLRKVDFWKIDLKGPTRYLIRHFHFTIINKQL